MTSFVDVNISVYGNSDSLKFTFSFKCVVLENQKSIYFKRLLYIATFYLLFIPVSFMKIGLNIFYFNLVRYNTHTNIYKLHDVKG